MRSVESRGVTRGVIRTEKVGPSIDQLGLPPRLDKRLKRGGIWTINALITARKEDLLPDGIGPYSNQVIQRGLDHYTRRESKRRERR